MLIINRLSIMKCPSHDDSLSCPQVGVAALRCLALDVVIRLLTQHGLSAVRSPAAARLRRGGLLVMSVHRC